MRFWYLFFCFVLVFGCSEAPENGDFGSSFWEEEGYFIQKTIIADRLEEGIIRAKVDGKWQEFVLENLPAPFVNWNLKARKESLKNISEGKMPSLAGPHNGIVATYGYCRQDSRFKLNNAIKGCGFLPKKEKIKEMNRLLADTDDADFTEKLSILNGFYENAEEIFDLNKQVSLELYSNPERGTQTFLNQMSDPTSVIVFMDIPTFKLKTLAYLLHPQNPELSEYEKDIVEYVNRVHSYFHGHFDRDFITVIYNIVEVYNSSPGTEQGKGTRMMQ